MGKLEMKSIIVVSDVHLGHKRSNFEEFNEFLGWIRDAYRAPTEVVVTFEGKEKEITYPETIIFLGDILELWEPKNDDFRYVGKQSKEFLEKIIDLPCEKIYVLGNHDKSLEEFSSHEYDLSSGNFEIFYKHFPENAKAEYLTIGKERYFFIHGHQFDKDMRYFKRLGEIGPSVLLSLQRINKQLFRIWGFGSTILAVVLYCMHLYVFENVLLYAVAALFPFWGTNLAWRLGRPITRKLCKARDIDIESIVENGWYDPKEDTIAAENLVFAHTHSPGIEKGETLKKITEKNIKKELLVNTGSWFAKERITNTFLYIDEKEILLLRWRKEIPEILISYDIGTNEIRYSKK
ncbi:MAG TPA: hypothetical protein ENI52_02580 [Thermoplasmata archaeon]|nr:hypothetical protein [Thermoplasmata archaeon]